MPDGSGQYRELLNPILAKKDRGVKTAVLFSQIQKEKADSNAVGLMISGRDDRIRTCGLFVPNEARYQTVPHPAVTRNIIREIYLLVKHFLFLWQLLHIG